MPFLQHAVTFAQCRITLANQVKKAFDLLEFQSRMLKANQPQKFFHFLAVEDTASRPVSRDVQDSFFFKKTQIGRRDACQFRDFRNGKAHVFLFSKF